MVENALFTEVEDVMCDQGIISTELNVTFESETSHLSSARLRIVVTLFARAVMPAVVRFYYAYLRSQQNLVDSLRHQLLPAVFAFVANSISRSLASVQRGITYPLLLRAIKQPEPPPHQHILSSVPEKSVDCQVLFTPDEGPLVDVIFIHGLHGGVDKTWKQGRWRRNGHKLRNQLRSQSVGDLCLTNSPNLKRTFSDFYWRSPKIAKRESDDCISRMEGEWEVIESVDLEDDYSNCWPQDWIPKDCPGVRVIALNYTTDVLWCPVWVKKRIRTDMVARSNEMIDELLKLEVGKRPVIWVGHSKGGLFIKQILVNAWEHHYTNIGLNNLFSCTKGIMFYSVPHKGSSLADITIPLLRRSVELVEIQRNCNFVLDLHQKFLEICNNNNLGKNIYSFIETSFTFMSFIYLKIVAYDSADPDIGVKYGIPLDHREICKPAGRDCFLYLELVKLIRKYSKNNDTSDFT